MARRIGDELEALPVAGLTDDVVSRGHVVGHLVSIDEDLDGVVEEGSLASCSLASTNWSRTRKATKSERSVWAARICTLRSSGALECDLPDRNICPGLASSSNLASTPGPYSPGAIRPSAMGLVARNGASMVKEARAFRRADPRGEAGPPIEQEPGQAASLLDPIGVRDLRTLLAEPEGLGQGLLQQGPRLGGAALVPEQEGQAGGGHTGGELGLGSGLSARSLQDRFQDPSSLLPVGLIRGAELK